jgi:hypothetical protein
MATLIRSTKSGSKWTKNELRAYNITVTPQNVATYFGTPTLPQSSVHQVILHNEEYPPNGLADKDDRNFFYLEEVMAIPPREESALMILPPISFTIPLIDSFASKKRHTAFRVRGANTC